MSATGATIRCPNMYGLPSPMINTNPLKKRPRNIPLQTNKNIIKLQKKFVERAQIVGMLVERWYGGNPRLMYTSSLGRMWSIYLFNSMFWLTCRNIDTFFCTDPKAGHKAWIKSHKLLSVATSVVISFFLSFFYCWKKNVNFLPFKIWNLKLESGVYRVELAWNRFGVLMMEFYT